MKTVGAFASPFFMFHYAMKRIVLYACLTGMVSATLADDRASVQVPANAAPSAAREASEKQLSPVARALSQLTYVSETKPRLDAKYYVFLHTASWCASCCVSMPKVIQAIKEMQAEKAPIEVVLISYDHTASEGVQYAQSSGHDFPVVMDGARGIYSVPGNKRAGGIPDIRIVTADGELVYSGLAKYLLDWKEHISKFEQEKSL